MDDFFSSFNAGLKNLPDLAMKKWKLDMDAARWREQLDEAKRTHNINLGMKFLESGDVTNAERFLRSAIPGGVSVETLTQSPIARLNQAKTEEAIRSSNAKKGIVDEVRSIMEPRTVQAPIDLGIGGELPEGVEVPTTAKTIPGRDLTTKDFLRILMKHDPESGATLKAMTTQAGIETALDKLKTQAEYNKALLDLRDRELPIKEMLAIAAMTRADKYQPGGSGGESAKKLPPSYDKAVDNAIGELYLSDKQIGPDMAKRLQKARIMDQRASAFDVMDQSQQVAALRIKELATEALQSGRAKTVQSAVRMGLSEYHKEQGGGKASAGSSGGGAVIIKWGRDANGNPVRIGQ